MRVPSLTTILLVRARVGRNEEAGLRCVYHGWKLDTDGTCVDMPNEPAESDFRSEVKATAYPGQERSLQSYTGLSSVHLEDLAITESMGTLLDRSAEHLGTSDVMVIRTRRRLMAAATALRERGEVPPGADNPLVYRTRSGSAFLPKDADWIAATEDLRKAFVEHPELDPDPRVLA
ncbi:MAG: hypothetical protein JO057_11790 [Chloroflexi bacterium]|nr:hypothetical protein [Chloroflexota bacterium]